MLNKIDTDKKNTLPALAVLVMCQVYTEMNTIRARDGVPYCFDGRKSDVSQEYWDSLMDTMNNLVTTATGTGCWLNPCLYGEMPAQICKAHEEDTNL